METDGLAVILSGTSWHAPRLCRVAFLAVTIIRLGSLVLGAKTIWRDETAALSCNSSAERCLLSCFDHSFPISPFNLFLLQMASSLTHGVACAFLFQLPAHGHRKGTWWRGDLCGRSQKLHLHLLSLLAKVALEGVFLATLQSLYGRYPSCLSCPPSALCPQATVCVVKDASLKDAFDLFMAGTGWASIALCLVALYPAIVEILSHPLGPGKAQLEEAVLLQSA